MDEQTHLKIAAGISLHPENFNLPLGSRVTNHPMGSVYLLALANFIGQGNLFLIRFIFILCSLGGLWGLFCLGTELFGIRAGIIALFLAAVDHHLIATSSLLLEKVNLCLYPWLLLAIYKKKWVFVGFYLGLGYMCRETFLLTLLPLSFIILLQPNIKTKQIYLGGIIFLVIISPGILWNLSHQGVNYVRHLDRIGPLSLTPRVLLLYIGNLLICFKDSAWLIMQHGVQTYLPVRIPCHWVSGIFYLLSLGYSFRLIKEQKIAFLIIFILGIFAPVSIINAREPWNEFEWADPTLFAVILLSAHLCTKIKNNHAVYRTIITGGVMFLFFNTTMFLNGPKFGYNSPCWEKAFIGKVLSYPLSGQPLNHASKLINKTLQDHPDNFIVHYFACLAARSQKQYRQELNQSKRLDPDNPLLHLETARNLIKTKKFKQAQNLLIKALRQTDYIILRNLLGKVEFKLGNFTAAEKQCLQIIALKPDQLETYLLLFKIRVALGQNLKALDALDYYALRQQRPLRVYLDFATTMENINPEMAQRLYERAMYP